MADIRSMLRNELAARNKSASASPSTTSQSHLQSTKKRKYEIAPTELHPQSTSSTANDDVRKRQRSGAYPAVNLDADARDASAMSGIEETEAGSHHHLPAGADAGDVQETMLQTAPPAPAPVEHNALDDEWALFEQEVIAPTKESDAAAASYAHTFTSIHTSKQTNPAAVISAPAVTAKELARQEAEEAENERRRREFEKQREELLQGEKEDAEQFLVEEFDEMERLEERLKRLRERKEEMERRRKEEKGGAEKMEGVVEEKGTEDEDDDEEEEEEEEEEEWDEWGFGR